MTLDESVTGLRGSLVGDSPAQVIEPAGKKTGPKKTRIRRGGQRPRISFNLSVACWASSAASLRSAPASCPLARAGAAGLPHRLQSRIPQLTPGAFVQAVCQGGDLRHHGQPFPPLRGYCLGSVICPGDLPIDGAGRVGVVPEVDDP